MASRAFVSLAERAHGLLGKPQEETPKGLFQTNLSSDLPAEEKQPRRIVNEIFNLLIAGNLTTSKTAAIAVYHLLANPEANKQLRIELLEAILDKNTMPSVAVLQKLPMLVCVLLPHLSTRI